MSAIPVLGTVDSTGEFISRHKVKPIVEFLKLCTDNERKRCFELIHRLHETGRNIESEHFFRGAYERTMEKEHNDNQ